MKLSVKKISLIILLFIIIGSYIYSNTLSVPFVFDDVGRIKGNPDISVTEFSLDKFKKAAFGKSSPKKRPVGNITFALNYYFHQYSLPGYHIVNIIIHILNGILLYLFINITLRVLKADSSKPKGENKKSIPESINSSFIAFFAAFFWLVNPVHTQSVTYIVQRLNSLAAMFFIVSFLFYVKGRISQRQSSSTTKSEKNAKSNLQRVKSSKLKAQSKITALKFGRSLHYLWFAGSALAWILALGCKQTAATLPFFVILYEWYFFQDLSREWLKRNLKYFLGILIVFFLVAVLYLGVNPLDRIQSITDYAKEEFTFFERVLTQFRVVIYYLGLLFYPHPSRLRLDYDFPLSHSLINPVTTLLSICAIIGLIVLAFYSARKDPLISFCIFWFFGNLIIESSIIPLAIIFEHRTYLPSMLVCLVFVILAFRYIKQKWFVAGLLSAVIIVFSIWTYQRNNVWKNPVSLWSDNVQKSPNKARTRGNLGIALFDQGRLEDAVYQFREAIRIKPDHTDAHLKLGNALEAQGNLKKAIYHYSETLRIKPDHTDAHLKLGNALEAQGNPDEAFHHYAEALRNKPEHEGALNNMGVALMRRGRIEEAVHYFSKVVRINPDFVQAYNNMGYILAQQGRTGEAIRNYEKALSIEPDFVQALNNLAVAYTGKGEYDKAISLFKKIIGLQPDSPSVYYYMACIYSEQNKIQESIDCIKNAIRTGFKDWDLLKTDENLQNVRNSSSFKALLRNY
ncbi:MAG: tetratricopeptide repeat protein [Deltaproteobacteria bacterium]|nr:tetratricopeptide repeat protein [Deltaproteobacteria bacterium]